MYVGCLFLLQNSGFLRFKIDCFIKGKELGVRHVIIFCFKA